MALAAVEIGAWETGGVSLSLEAGSIRSASCSTITPPAFAAGILSWSYLCQTGFKVRLAKARESSFLQITKGGH